MCQGQSDEGYSGGYGEGSNKPQDQSNKTQAPHHQLGDRGQDQVTLDFRLLDI